jgi:shikimate dehydrogenase
VVKAVGSANTLVMRSNVLYADNTDLPGFLFMLEKGGISLKNKKVLILGSGGTSLTAQAACRAEGGRPRERCQNKSSELSR